MAISLNNRRRIRQLHAMLGSQNQHERETARAKLDDLMQKLRLSWNDLPELLATAADADSNDDVADNDVDDDGDHSVGPATNIPNALELCRFMVTEFIELKQPAEYLAVALWILHSHVYNQFLVTPRLALLSPVRGCGKTTLLALLGLLVARALRTDNITAAAIYHLIDQQARTLLVDEADNVGLEVNGPLRAVLNSGHRKGGSITRMNAGLPRIFSTFAPVAIAAIDILPLPLMARSIVIPMQRADGSRKLRQLDDVHAAADLDLAYRHVLLWARDARIEPDPAMPAGLRNRAADNWRPLIAIADSFGPVFGVAARDAAVALSQGTDEDVGVLLLSDIRDVFDHLRVDRISSAELVECLVGMEDAGWGEFRGQHDNQSPRRLSQSQLATLLRKFRIRPRSVWSSGGTKSRKGYLRSWFEAAWAAYCPRAGRPAGASKIKRLREV